jgi:hypothetical protein
MQFDEIDDLHNVQNLPNSVDAGSERCEHFERDQQMDRDI